MVRYNTTRYSTVQYSTVQYNAIQYGTVARESESKSVCDLLTSEYAIAPFELATRTLSPTRASDMTLDPPDSRIRVSVPAKQTSEGVVGGG